MAEFTPLETFRESVGQPDPDRSARIRDEFRDRIATMAPDESGRRPFDPAVIPPPIPTRPRRRQPVLALVALAVIAGMAAGSAFLLRDEAANGSIEQLTATARAQTDVALASGEYLFLAERTSAKDAATERQQWTALDGTGQATESAMVIGPSGTSEPSMTVYSTPGSLDFAGLSYDELRTLPTGAEPLIARLAALGLAGTNDPAAQAEAIAAILALEVTPPDVAGAGLRALEVLGGRSIGPVTDTDGRVGVGVRGDNGDGTSWLVVVDASSARALAFHPHTTSATVEDAAGRLWTDQDITESLPGS